MNVQVFDTKSEMAAAAASHSAAIVRAAVAARGEACVVAATGASQFEFLDALAAEPDVEWAKTTFFHLDEYVGLPETHPASFRAYLRERVVDRLHPGVFHFVDGEAPDPREECRRLGELISRATVDVAFVGIGENGHVAFNDPHVADFDDPLWVKPVEIDDTSRHQQVRDGAFDRFEEVPRIALTVTMSTIRACRVISLVVPGPQKAAAVAATLDGPVTTACPASVLRDHPDAVLFVDEDAASLVEH